jgi:hypothetical protein
VNHTTGLSQIEPAITRTHPLERKRVLYSKRLTRDSDVKAKIKIMDPKSVDGHFDDGSVGNFQGNIDPDRFLCFDYSLSVAINTGEKPITSRTAALAAVIKHRDAHGNGNTPGRFLGGENHFNIQTFEPFTFRNSFSREISEEAFKQRLK